MSAGECIAPSHSDSFSEVSVPNVDNRRLCEVCQVSAFKYRCPRCLVKSCSLTCVQQHKLTSGCNGQRDKTAFVSLANFTDLNLLSDYRFLEDVERQTTQAAVERGSWRQGAQKRQQLMAEARRRRVVLRLAPYPLSQRLHNRTVYDHSQRQLVWHVSWLLPCPRQTSITSMVSEQMLLIDAVKDLLNHVCLASEKTTINGAVDFFTSQMSQTQDKTSGINFAGDKVVQSIAEETCAKDCLSEPSYEDEENGVKDVAVAAADTDWSVRDAVKPECHWKLFIQLHSRSQKMPLRCRYEELNVTKSLKDSLVGRMVIEHPTLHICTSQNHS